MEQWLQQFYAALPEGPLYYFCIWLIAFFESFLVVGLIVPGSVLIVFSGFLAANGKGDPLILTMIAANGAFLGDFISFLIGARAGGKLLKHKWVHRYRHPLARSFALLREHGAKSIFFGRFIGFLRPFVPFVAGCAHMRGHQFLLYAVISAVLWGIAYPGLGYVFGTSWHRVQVWSSRFAIVLGGILALWLFILWLRHRLKKEWKQMEK